MSDFQDISTSVVVHGAPKVEKFGFVRNEVGNQL